jgi:hypothetical protein
MFPLNKKVGYALALLLFMGMVFFGCSDSSSEEPPQKSSSSGGNGLSSSSDKQSSDSGEISNSSSSVSELFSSSSEAISSSLSSSSINSQACAAYQSDWCNGIAFSDVIKTSQNGDLGDGPKCYFATNIQKMGNQSATLLVNGVKLAGQNGGNVGGRCGKTDWGQLSCAEALNGVSRAGNGYYIYVEEWVGEFETTGGTPSCTGTGGNSSSSGTSGGSTSSASGGGGNSNCAYLPIWCNGAVQSTVKPTVPSATAQDGECFFVTSISKYCAWGSGDMASKINGVNVGQGNIGCWSSNGALPAKADGGYYILLGGGLSEWEGSGGSAPACSGGGGANQSTLTCTNLAATGIAGTAITRPTVKCDGTNVNNPSFTGAPNWDNPSASSYTVTASANCGGSSKTATCGTLTVSAPPANTELTCTGLATTGTEGTAIAQPTVKCGNTTVTATFTNPPTWNNPAANTYNVSAQASCGGSNKTATCGTLTVSALSLTCTGLPATGTSGTSIIKPTVKCGGTTINNPTLTSTPNGLNWDNPNVSTATTYSVSVAATPCGAGNKTATCGSITVNPKPAALNLTCANVPSTGTAGTSLTPPEVKCGTQTVPTANVTWKNNNANFSWSNLTAGTYNSINATASCDGSNKTANCSGTLTVAAQSSSSSGGGGNNDSYPTLQEGTSGVSTAKTTRYWDSCKPSCAWTANAGGTNGAAKSCNINGSKLSDANTKNACESGGSAYTCMDQAPWKVNDNVAYGFAASHSNSDCGKCFQLQFKDNGYGGSASIIGKTMIVMVSNIGGDVGGDQFDIMIPGGGVGIFNALSNQVSSNGGNSGNLGQQYGGFRATCGNNATCISNMCSSAFGSSGLSNLKAGCDWYVDWFKINDNPNVLRKEITCPQDLVNKYK